jgi:SAM-dependent methyltransferase
MNSDFAAQYRTLYENHWWWRAREAAILREVRRLLAPDGSHAILDVGCGDGLLFDRLAPYGRVEGVEVDALTVSPDSPWRDRIHLGPFDESFQPQRRYDLILMLDVLEHLPQPAAALRHAANLLTGDGALLITVPAFEALWTCHDDLNGHYTRFTKRTFAALAGDSGVDVRHMWYLFHWVFPAKLAVRMKERLVPTPPAPPAVPPAWINSLLTAATRCEQATISRLPMPFGTSLAAICRR